MNNEEDVKGFLGEHWLQGAEITVQEVLRQKNIGGNFEFARGSGARQIPDWFVNHRGVLLSMVEGKSETVMNAHCLQLLERADNGTEIVWGDHVSAGSHTANLLYKVQKTICVVSLRKLMPHKIAVYLGTYRKTWLCLTSLSCMLVFRLVRRSGGRPYLVVSDPVYVPDHAGCLTVVADDRLGRDWMPTLVATCLCEIAFSEPSLSESFVVPSSPVPIGDPAPPPEGYPAEIAGYGSGSETEAGHSDNSSDGTYCSTSSLVCCRLYFIVGHIKEMSPSQALVSFVDQAGNPLGFSALLTLSTPSSSTQLSVPPSSRHFISEGDAHWSSLPKLKLMTEIGQGFTGQVFSARWNGLNVVAKMSCDSDVCKHLDMEAA